MSHLRLLSQVTGHQKSIFACFRPCFLLWALCQPQESQLSCNLLLWWGVRENSNGNPPQMYTPEVKFRGYIWRQKRNDFLFQFFPNNPEILDLKISGPAFLNISSIIAWQMDVAFLRMLWLYACWDWEIKKPVAGTWPWWLAMHFEHFIAGIITLCCNLWGCNSDLALIQNEECHKNRLQNQSPDS